MACRLGLLGRTFFGCVWLLGWGFVITALGRKTIINIEGKILKTERYRLFRSESDEPVKVERYCNGHPCVGVGASSWLEWSSGGDGGPSVQDQTLLDAQVPG